MIKTPEKASRMHILHSGNQTPHNIPQKTIIFQYNKPEFIILPLWMNFSGISGDKQPSPPPKKVSDQLQICFEITFAEFMQRFGIEMQIISPVHHIFGRHTSERGFFFDQSFQSLIYDTDIFPDILPVK